MTTRQPRSGFSLVELMIAIMILGIGMVMVATVFPVGLDITRETLQMDISQAAADAAIANLRLRVPYWKELDQVEDYSPPGGLIGNSTHRVLVPDVSGTDLDAVIDADDAEVLTALQLPVPPGLPPKLNVPIRYNNWEPGWADGYFGLSLAPSQSMDLFFSRARVFTERTGWAAEMTGDLIGSWENSFVVPGQNLPLDYLSIYTDWDTFLNRMPTMIPPVFFAPPLTAALRADLPRVHLIDQVYPPVAVTEADGTTPRNVLRVCDEVASRRYSWTAIHHRISPEPEVDNLLATIVVTHRGDPNARYARQVDNSKVGGLQYNLADDDDRTALLAPQPDAPGADMLFPRPWLAMLSEVNLATGTVRCTAEVARLLPPDSFLVIARRTPPGTGPLFPGTAHKVISRTWNPGQLGKAPATQVLATLQIRRSNGQPATNVPVWVFPPAIEGGRTFASRSPVVGVALREVPIR